MALSDKIGSLKEREAPPAFMIAGLVVVVLAIGAGAFYAFNGGWKTSGQQDYEYQHNVMPLMAAKHGDKSALDAENKYRKEHGQPPLVMPNDMKAGVTNDPSAFKKLQDELKAKGAGAGP